MALLRVCGSFRSLASSKTLLSGSQNKMIQQAVKSFRTTMSSSLGSKPGPGLTPLVVKWSVVGFSGYLSLRFLPTAKCREARPEDSDYHTFKDPNGSEAKQKTPMDSFPFRQFLRMLIPHLGYLIVAIVSALATAYLNIEIPQSLGQIVNVVATFVRTNGNAANESMSNFLNQIRDPAKQIVKMYLAQAVLTFTYIYSLACVGERLAAEMRKNLFHSILHQDVAFFDTHRAGEINSRLSNDVQEFKSAFKHCISQGLRCSAQVIGSACAVYRISPEMTGMMLVVVPSVIAVGTFFGSFLRAISKMAQAQTAKASAVSDECVANIRTVRAFSMEESALQLYEKEIDEANQLHEWLGFGIGIFQGGTNLFLNGVVLGTLYYGGYLMSVGKVTPGDLMSFLVATQTIQRSIAQMSLLFGHFVRGMSSGARIFEYINWQPTIRTSGGKKIPYHSFFGDIEFRNVSFTYPTRPEQVVIENLNLQIKGGQMVALVGTSGGGKSTIAALLERFYDTTKGQITFDGIDIKDLDPSWLRGQAIGYINQEPVLFATSVLENIRYGRPSATDEEVFEAAKAANAHQFIENFPKGYQTVVGERGVTVSGGQKQRIAIARALLKNPAILILDEATSALDAESEKLVQDALDQVCKNRTVLVIAHRLSTIKKADVIAVISQGKIVELGSHEKLKKAGGVYSFLIKHQEF